MLPPVPLTTEPMQTREAVMDVSALALAYPALARATLTGLLAALDEAPRTVQDLAKASPDEPRVVRRMLDVAVAAGIAWREGDRYAASPGLLAMMRGPMRPMVMGATRSQMGQLADLLERVASPAPIQSGWAFTDPEILEAQGAASAMIPLALRELLPNMDDLGARLSRPGAAFLDVGTGVGRLAIAFAQAFPAARVVGVDHAPAPLALARKNVDAAGLAARIELRKAGIESLDERDAYDLAWVPVMFLPPDVLDATLPRLLSAVRRGGWVLAPVMDASPDGIVGAANALQLVLQGGEPRSGAQLVRALEEAGFRDARELGGGWVVGRRAP